MPLDLLSTCVLIFPRQQASSLREETSLRKLTGLSIEILNILSGGETIETKLKRSIWVSLNMRYVVDHSSYQNKQVKSSLSQNILSKYLLRIQVFLSSTSTLFRKNKGIIVLRSSQLFRSWKQRHHISRYFRCIYRMQINLNLSYNIIIIHSFSYLLSHFYYILNLEMGQKVEKLIWKGRW